jgi:hypothetical protein
MFKTQIKYLSTENEGKRVIIKKKKIPPLCIKIKIKINEKAIET